MDIVSFWAGEPVFCCEAALPLILGACSVRMPGFLKIIIHLTLPHFRAGYLDAGLKLQNSLTAPAIGGDVRLSRGVASLMPGGPSPPGSSSGGGNGASSSGNGQQSGLGALLDGGRARETDLVFKAFTVLAGKDALARQLSRFDIQQVCGVPSWSPCCTPIF